MSVETLAIVLHHSKARGTDKLVLVGIANHEGDGGAWPSVSTLARYANVEERAVQKALRRLKALGEVSVHVQGGGPSGVPEWRRPNRYSVLLACPATCDRTRNHRFKALPEAPSDLWINRVSPGTPGVPQDTPPPFRKDTPPPVRADTLTIHKNHPQNSGQFPESTKDRAGEAEPAVEPPCSICLRAANDCRSRVHVSGHQYVPKERPR